MSIKVKYWIFIILLHAILVTLIYYVLIEKKTYFIASEVLVIISLFFSYLIYKSFIKPIELLQSGTDAIADADFNIKYLNTGSKEIDKLVNVYNDMIDNLRGERTKMSQQSYFIQNLIEVTPVGIVIMDFDNKVSTINPAACSILNLEEEVVGQLLSQQQSELINALLELPLGVSKMISPNGLDKFKCQTNEVIHQGFKRKFILIDDLSSELLKSEKDAYGRIIRMMAHEVNNSIGAINSIMDSVVEFGLKTDDEVELKESLLIARDRNKSLSRFMDNYASILRLPKPQFQKLDLANFLKKNGQLFRSRASEKNIEITYEIPTHFVVVDTDPILLEQAFSNILKNALEAIEEDGVVRITCTDEPKAFIVSDNGSGIDKEMEAKLFTPFFSTKPTGQGVGLMLIREILESLNAKFELKSDRKSGWTHFKVWF